VNVSLDELPTLRVPAWQDIRGLVHGFCGRRGGASRGPFGELNLSFRVGDADEAVRENWRRVVASTGRNPSAFATMQQVHGAQIARVEAPGEAPEVDGLVTAVSFLALSVLTADCVPILFLAPSRRVIAAAHAGWRGTVAGIAPRMIESLKSGWGVGVTDVLVALGPAIGGCCYEVGLDVIDALEERWGTTVSGAVARRNGHKAMLDLRHANRDLLRQAGVAEANITSVGPCTRCTPTDYFSYRAGGATGRQLSFIAITA